MLNIFGLFLIVFSTGLTNLGRMSKQNIVLDNKMLKIEGYFI